MTTHTCIIGDSRRMDEIDSGSIHLVVTSPPYWQLKDYGAPDQIGFNHSYEDYINNLNLVWGECQRVLHPGCRMVVNVGDQFARAAYYGRYKVIPIRTEIIKFCETVGFDYMGAIIWRKKTTMNTTGGGTIMGSFPYPRNGIVEIDYEFILIFKKPGRPPRVTREQKEKSIIPKEKWKEYFSGHWTFNGSRQEGHIASFPVELPRRAIEMFTFAGERVLDPFLGSGTTMAASVLTGRNSVGYEVNPEFLPVIEKKVNELCGCRRTDFTFDVKKPPSRDAEWEREIEKQDYVFSDPIRFDIKADPRSFRFGSKISVGDMAAGLYREEYFTVKEIIDANVLALSNDLTVRLMGVRPHREKAGEALDFLRNKILKRQVYLKYDVLKHDGRNMPLAYVYAKNRTFINAHLLKKGFAGVDDEFPFRYRNKFEKIVTKNSEPGHPD